MLSCKNESNFEANLALNNPSLTRCAVFLYSSFFDPDPGSSCFGVSHYGGNVSGSLILSQAVYLHPGKVKPKEHARVRENCLPQSWRACGGPTHTRLLACFLFSLDCPWAERGGLLVVYRRKVGRGKARPSCYFKGDSENPFSLWLTQEEFPTNEAYPHHFGTTAKSDGLQIDKRLFLNAPAPRIV